MLSIMLNPNYRMMLLEAARNTLILALVSLVLACVLGLIFGLMNVSRNRVMNFIGTVYVDAVRGVPLIVLAFFIYFGVPVAMQQMGLTNFRLDVWKAGTAALSLNCGAYMAEIIRAGIQSVDRGQMEAARSLGMSYGHSMRKVVLPQAVRTMIPSFINQFIITLKDTSIISAIGLPELTNVGRTIANNSMDLLGGWALIGLIYMIVIVALSKLAKNIERRVNRGR